MSRTEKTKPRTQRIGRIVDKIHPAKIGAPPGTPVPVGPTPAFTPFVTAIRFCETNMTEWIHIDPTKLATLISENSSKLSPKLDPESPSDGGWSEDNVVWIDVEGIHDVSLIAAVAQPLELHPLTIEDIVNNGLRPVFESYPGYFFFALNMIYLAPDDPPGGPRTMVTEHVSLVLRDKVLCTFQEKPGDTFGRIRDRIRTKTGKVRTRGADHLLYTLLDAIVDGYLQVVDHLAERIEKLEDDLRQGPRDLHLQQIYALKRDILWLRKSIYPVRDLLSKVQVEQSVFQERTKIYLRDLSDHTTQVTDALQLALEMVAVLFDTWHSMTNQKMNAITKTLTMISTVFLPLNFIAGVYGMNFHHMPELASEWGYPAILSTMLLVAVAIVAFFINRGWLWEKSG